MDKMKRIGSMYMHDLYIDTEDEKIVTSVNKYFDQMRKDQLELMEIKTMRELNEFPKHSITKSLNRAVAKWLGKW